MFTIRLPLNNGEETTISNKSSIVLVGANGSGKTRMSTWIESNNPSISIHRISAQKSLNMPSRVSPSEFHQSQEEFLYGTSSENKNWLKGDGKRNMRWGNNPDTHLLNDFELLMKFLVTEEYEKTIEYRNKHKEGNLTFDNETRLEKVKRIWESVIINKKLKISAGKIEVSDIGESIPFYNSAEMSDGERAIFYFIGEVVSVPENSLIIVDEPENHLHKSILIRLWNAIEAEKPDCTFMYITHNLEFAVSRNNSQIIWVKNMVQKNEWEYELLDDEFSNDALKIEILGNRQKVLLIEGTPEKSTDKKIYSQLFGEYNIIPLESCNRVISFTKAYKRLAHLHYDDVKGIIDRDRHSEEEIRNFKEDAIYCPQVAEIENLFMLPEIIEIVCIQQNKSDDYEKILADVQEKTFEFLQNEIEQQTLLFVRQQLLNEINKLVNQKSISIEEYKTNISAISEKINIDERYQQVKDELLCIVQNKDYLCALKVINNKGLLPYTGLTNCFGWKKDFYVDYVIRLLSKKDTVGMQVASIFKAYIDLE